MVPINQATARLAAGLVDDYGEDAALAASQRAEAMERFGHSEAATLWAAVGEILARRKGKGSRPL